MTDKTQEEKLLTFAVPAYNAEQYLHKCLMSFCVPALMGRFQVLVIDDGSTDATGAIAEEYCSCYPETFSVIHKENGGHGSGINIAVDMAAGRFFKVVDADDWIVTENLGRYLDTLENTDADVVINEYQSINQRSGRVIDFRFHCEVPRESIGLEHFMEFYDDVRDCCSFHGVTYRTESYRAVGHRLTEGVFYEDQEYSTIPFAGVKKLLFCPFMLYQYLVGNGNQSISFHNQVKRIGHIKKVLESNLAFWKERGPFPPALESLFEKKLSVLAASYYSVALVKNPDKREGRGQAERFSAWLREASPVLYAQTAKKRRTMEWMNRLHISPYFYQMILDTPIYIRFREIWTR